MNLDYKITTKQPDNLRSLHNLSIDGECIATTKRKEVLAFCKKRFPTKIEWKTLKEAIRLGQPLMIRGGQ